MKDIPKTPLELPFSFPVDGSAGEADSHPFLHSAALMVESLWLIVKTLAYQALWFLFRPCGDCRGLWWFQGMLHRGPAGPLESELFLSQDIGQNCGVPMIRMRDKIWTLLPHARSQIHPGFSDHRWMSTSTPAIPHGESQGIPRWSDPYVGDGLGPTYGPTANRDTTSIEWISIPDWFRS